MGYIAKSAFSTATKVMAAMKLSRVIRSIHALLYILATAIYVTSICLKPDHLPTYTTTAFIVSSNILYWTHNRNGGRMVKLADQLSSSLNSMTIERLQAADRRFTLPMVVGFATIITLKIATTTILPSTEFWDLATSYPKTQYDYILDTGLLVITQYLIVLSLVLVLFYTHLNVMLGYHCQFMISLCDNAQREPSSLTVRFYKSMMKHYADHIQLKYDMNSLLGLTPLCFMTSLFVSDLTGLSYLIVAGSKLSKEFILLTIFPSTLGGHCMAYYLCLKAGGATEKLKCAAKTLLLLTSQETSRETNGERRLRRLLHQKVGGLEPEPARIYSLFTVDTQVALGFMAQVVPFTVMVVTSMSSLAL
ncbi:hypothetical protein HDE_09530 [Halotydeus destructor]|nr:hypothetical protein HDE_09530 [Halotydeus destructor]